MPFVTPVRTVLIDVDDTLLDFHKCAVWSMHRAAKEEGIALPSGIEDAFFRINDGLWRDVEAGRLERQELYAVRWRRIFAACGVTNESTTFEGRFREGISLCAEPTEGARELLLALHGKVTLCAASNAAEKQQLRRLADAGFLPFFDHVFCSETLGADKPTKAYFDACFAALPDAALADTVLIGDSLSADIAGGVAYGIGTVWFNFRGRVRPEDAPVPDKTVTSLGEIPALLGL